MRLTKFSDFALRALLYAAVEPGGRTTIGAAADAFGISRAHLKKVVHDLADAGYVTALRGRGGGYALAMPADQINLGAALRRTEPDFGLFECFQEGNVCPITRLCRLPRVANEALAAFLAVFDRHTLADVLVTFDRKALRAPFPEQPLRGPSLPPAP
jgi:Rrf2 family nitric oxide-sensitive transcriptional repressor